MGDSEEWLGRGTIVQLSFFRIWKEGMLLFVNGQTKKGTLNDNKGPCAHAPMRRAQDTYNKSMYKLGLTLKDVTDE